MLERMKSLLLIILVLLSLLFTGLIWTSQPQYDLIQQTTYQKRELIGESRQFEELIRPRHIVYHFANGEHGLAYPEQPAYETVLERGLKDWVFFNLTPKYLSLTQWEELLSVRTGIEIRYPTSISAETLERLLPFKVELPKQLKQIDRLWYFVEPESNDVRVLLISDEDERCYLAQTAVSAATFMDEYLVLGESLPRYGAYYARREEEELNAGAYYHVFYLPLLSQEESNFDFFYRPITPEVMQRALFLDPSIVRRIQERDGSLLYTDGKRSMQVDRLHEGMTYYDPFMGTMPLTTSSLNDALNFINEHHGWTDRYYLEMVTQNGEETTYQFRKYLSHYPIVSFKAHDPLTDYSAITLTLVGGIPTEYQHPLFELDRHYANRKVRVLAGEEVLKRLRWDGIELEEIKTIYLAREAHLGQDYVRLHLIWVVELEDGRILRYFNPEVEKS